MDKPARRISGLARFRRRDLPRGNEAGRGRAAVPRADEHIRNEDAAARLGEWAPWKPHCVGGSEAADRACFPGAVSRDHNRVHPISQAAFAYYHDSVPGAKFGAMAKKVMVQRPFDGPRRLVAERIAELGLDMANLSRELGHNHAYLQQYVRYAIPSQLKEDDRHRLAALLRVDQRALKPGGEFPGLDRSPDDGIPPLDPRLPGDVRDAPQVRFGAAQLRPENVPVRGVVRGGQGGSFELNIGDPIEYVRRPLSLIGKGEIYALHVESDSMAPRYEPGEIILVWAKRPALIGRDVVVQLRPSHDGENPRAYLKRLIRRNDKELVLEQFNPRKTMSLKMKDVISVHLVLTRDEML